MIRIPPAILILAISTVSGQSFEVASIHVHPDPPHSINISTSGPRLNAEAEFAAGLILWAFDLKNYQLAWAPNVKREDIMYDIAAKAEGDAVPTKDQFHKMMQALLTDRFQLKVHHEQREMQVYALIVGKGGPKFKESAPDAPLFGQHSVNGRNQIMALPSATMEQFASELGLYVPGDRPVVDRTGLAGTYAIRFEATPFFRLRNGSETDDIDALSGVQEQLGLKLEPQKARIDVLVIDHLEKPTEN